MIGGWLTGLFLLEREQMRGFGWGRNDLVGLDRPAAHGLAGGSCHFCIRVCDVLGTGSKTMKISLCRSCRARVIWARYVATGNLAPFDALPHEDGTWFLQPNLVGEVMAYQVDDDAQVERRKCHFATCPEAKAWRKAAR
jgi:hypothetical protein